MMLKSKDYWAKRATALEYYIQQDAVKTREEILKLISEAAGNIDEEIYKIRRELGKLTGKVTEEELNELLSSSRRDVSYRELKELLDIAETDAERADIMNRMNAQAYGARLTRYDEVANKILAEYTKVAHKERVLCKDFFSSVLCESYYTNIYNLAEGYNAGVSFDVLPRRAINKTLQEKWHSSNYSERIWKHSKAFAKQVEQTIISGLMSGKSTPKMAMELDTFTKEDVYYVKERLIRTETSHFMAEGQKEAYETAGIKKYRFMAALSERTCELCGELDGKTFFVEEATEGVNYPTIHVNCRCTTITADAKLSTRNARDPVTGKNYKVDGNMDFAQWKESLSDEQKDAFNLHVRQLRNKSADQKQYNKYVQHLGIENMPKDFKAFQNFKYIKVDEWELLKDYYKSRGTNMISAFTTFDDYVLYKNKIKEVLVDMKTVDGIEIKGQSKHFIERVFGTNQDPKTKSPRNGVEIEDIKDALIKPIYQKEKRNDGSQKYIGMGATVTINADTGILIQCNPTDRDIIRRKSK